jgi:aldose 1-epimerase
MACCSLRYRGEELLARRDGIPLLHPWANRLGAWSYEALGKRVELDGALVRADERTGLPNHGTRPRPWRVVGDGVAELDGASDAFPFAHTMRIEVSAGEDVLRIATTLTAHDEPVPVAFGYHPYLVLPRAARRDWHVELPVRRRLVLSNQLLPTGETEPVEPYAGALGELAFDDGYEELGDAPFALEGGGRRIEVAFEEGYPVAQVFAPLEYDLVCFEPMTALADALRTGGFQVATPGRPYRATFSIAVRDS